MTKVEDTFELIFKGFTWMDPTQVAHLRLFFKDKEIPLDGLTTFKRHGNQGMPNEELQNYKKIFHNGSLTIKMHHRHVRSYICGGGQPLVRNPDDLIWVIDPGNTNTDPTEQIADPSDVVVLGSCHLNGDNKKFIPSLSTVLGDYFPGKKITTFPTNGINDCALLHNAIWFANHCQVKNLILTMNIGGKFVAKTRFLDQTLYVPSMGIRFSEDVPDFERKRKLQKYVIRRKTLWFNILNKKLKKLLDICRSKKINVQLLNYTSKHIWFKDHEYIDLFNKYIDKKCLLSEDRSLLRDCYVRMFKKLKIL